MTTAAHDLSNQPAPAAAAATTPARAGDDVDGPPSAYRPRNVLLLALIIALAAGLRVHGLTRHSLWTDELFTLETSAGHGLEHQRLTHSGYHAPPPDLLSLDNAGPWWRVATSLARDDNHPPLFFLLVRIWRHPFGDGDAALRSLSLLVSLVSVCLLFDAVSSFHGVGAGLWAAVLMAVAGPEIQYAQEGRSYALLITLTCGAAAALARISRRGVNGRRLVALGGCVLAMMLTHYYAIAGCIAIGLYVILALRGCDRRRAVTALLVAAALFALLWGPGAWRQRKNIAANNSWVRDERPDHLAQTFSAAALVPARLLNEPRTRVEWAAAAGSLLLLLPLPLLRRMPGLLLWWLILVCNVGLVLASDLIHHGRQLEFIQYTMGASIAVYAMLAALASLPVARFARVAPVARVAWLAVALPALAVLSCLLALPQVYAQPASPKPDWREYAALIDRLATPTDAIIFFDRPTHTAGFTGSHYVALRHYAKKLPPRTIFADTSLDPALLPQLRSAGAVWGTVPFEISLPTDALPGFVSKDFRRVWGLPALLRWTRAGASTEPASH